MSIEWGVVHGINMDCIMGYQPYLIGGSYITNKETANDVDVVIHEYKLDEGMDFRLRNNGFSRLQKGDKKYDAIDHERLVAVYEGRVNDTKVNVIVVGVCYWPAYIASINEMASNPEYYQTREKRVALHKANCKIIRDMITEKQPEF